MDLKSDIELRPDSKSGLFLEALYDFFSTLRNVWMWSSLAFADIEFRYRRTVLGPFWITGGSLSLVLSLGLVYSSVFGQKLETYLPYLSIGIVYWGFIAGTLTEGCMTFVSNSSLIKSTSIDLSTHMFRMILRSFIILVHNFVAVALVWFWFRWPITVDTLLVIPALFLGLTFTTGLTLCLAMVCTRYRDVQQIVIAVMQLIFFVTPVFWVATALRPGHQVLIYNPFYYILEIVRMPLLGKPPSFEIWAIATAIAAASLICGTSVYCAFRHRITYWL